MSVDFYKEGFKAFDPNISRTLGDMAVIFYQIQGIFDDLDSKWPNDGYEFRYPNPKWTDFCHGYEDAFTEHNIKENTQLTNFVKYCISNNIEFQPGGFYKIKIGEASYNWSTFKDIFKYLSRKNNSEGAGN